MFLAVSCREHFWLLIKFIVLFVFFLEWSDYYFDNFYSHTFPSLFIGRSVLDIFHSLFIYLPWRCISSKYKGLLIEKTNPASVSCRVVTILKWLSFGGALSRPPNFPSPCISFVQSTNLSALLFSSSLWTFFLLVLDSISIK